MGIRLEITDLHATPPHQLIKLAEFILGAAGYVAQVGTARAIPNPPGPEQLDQMQADRENNTQEFHSGGAFPGMPKDMYEEPTQQFAPGTPEAAFAASVPHPPQAPGIEVDAQGFPWDSRIHSSSRERIADGTWRQRRNLKPDVRAAVEAELRKVMAAPSIPAFLTAEVPPPPPAMVPPPPPFVPSVVVPAAPVNTTPPPPIPPAGVAPIASPGNAPTFQQLMAAVVKAVNVDRTIDQAKIVTACQSVGLESFPNLATRPDLVGAVALALGLTL